MDCLPKGLDRIQECEGIGFRLEKDADGQDNGYSNL
jgi:hypothetical protein